MKADNVWSDAFVSALHRKVENFKGVPVVGFSKSIRVGDIDISFTQAGEGEPVVFIHGLAEDKSSWEYVIASLAPQYSCYALDLRGHGGTTVGKQEGSVDQLADDLLGFLREVSGPAVCVGYSLGGVIVLAAALKDPELVRQAVVAGTSSKVGRVAKQFFQERIELVQNDFAAFSEELGRDTDAQIELSRDRVTEVTKRRVAAVGNGAGYINAARAMIELSDNPISDQLKNLSCPIDIIHANKDVFCPLKAAEILKAAMPDAGYHEITDAGHLMSVDQPEQYAKAVSAALARVTKSK